MSLLKNMRSLSRQKKFIREKRSELELDSRISIKMIFAEDELEAEQRLREPRNAPILREWEK